MRNMFNVLYTKYIDQIKVQEIQNYNEKHHDYLARHFHTIKNPSKLQNNQAGIYSHHKSELIIYLSSLSMDSTAMNF